MSGSSLATTLTILDVTVPGRIPRRLLSSTWNNGQSSIRGMSISFGSSSSGVAAHIL